MPKATVRDAGWREDQATEAQVTRLLVLLRANEIIDPGPNETLEDWETEAVNWASDYLPSAIRRLSDLTKGEIQMLFEHLD